MKLKLLKDMPGFPEGTVFYLDKNVKGESVWVWQHRRDKAMVGSTWLQDLLYGCLPYPSDENAEFFEQIIEEGDKCYSVGYDGKITEFNHYTWWGNTEAPNVFTDLTQAEKAAQSIKQIFSSKPMDIVSMDKVIEG